LLTRPSRILNHTTSIYENNFQQSNGGHNTMLYWIHQIHHFTDNVMRVCALHTYLVHSRWKLPHINKDYHDSHHRQTDTLSSIISSSRQPSECRVLNPSSNIDFKHLWTLSYDCRRSSPPSSVHIQVMSSELVHRELGQASDEHHIIGETVRRI
jgi:hypothetical protein